MLSLQGSPSLPPKCTELQLSDVPTAGARNHTNVQEDLRRDHRHREQAEGPAQPTRGGQIRCQSPGGGEVET